jgi:cell division protein ZapA
MNKPTQKQLEVQIMGQSYLLACPAGGEASLLDAVERVDSAMCRIRDAGRVKARDRIAVLASLNLAYELSQKEAQAYAPTAFAHSEPAMLGEPIADPVDPAARARADDLIRRLDQALNSDGQLL